MKRSQIQVPVQLVALLGAFATVLLSSVGVQMQDGPMRIALVLAILLLTPAVGALLAVGFVQRDGRDEWEKGGNHGSRE